MNGDFSYNVFSKEIIWKGLYTEPGVASPMLYEWRNPEKHHGLRIFNSKVPPMRNWIFI